VNEASHQAVEELVAHYQAKARAVSRTGVAIGAFVGVLIGSIPLSPLRAAWPIPSTYGFATLLGGLVVGVLIGFVVGDPRGKLYQRMAEQARLQLQLEQRISQNDARMGQLLTALTARAAAAAQRPPAPQPPAEAPAPAPAPQLVAAPQAVELPVFDTPPPRLRTVPLPDAPAVPPLSPPVSG
jgi:predicted lipid-binding transport protein (Tim44 family)